MLRCPECSRIYKDGTQKFCTNDGGRLIRSGGSSPAAALAQTVEAKYSRRSAPGELLVETVIAPSLNGLPLAPTTPHEVAPPFAVEPREIEPVAPELATPESNKAEQSAASPVKTARALGQIDDFAPNSNEFDDYQSKELSKRERETTNSSKTRAAESKSSKPKISGAKRKNAAPAAAMFALAALLLLSALAFVGANYLPREAVQPQPIVGRDTTAPPQSSVGTVAPPSFLAPETVLPRGFVEFENSKDALNDKLQNKFVGFAVSYPESWKRSAPAKNSSNFLDVANLSVSRLPLEQLLVSWYDSRGSFAADQTAFPTLTKKYAAKIGDPKNGIPNFRKVSEGAIKFNSKDAYEFRFAGEFVKDGDKPIKIWGRTIFLPIGKENATTGLTLTLLTTSLEPTISSAEDVGEQGELARVIQTFRFTK